MDSLKPFTLKLDTLPTEFTLWKKELRTYYDSSEMMNMSVAEQQGHVRLCMEPALYSKIMGAIKADTPIYGQAAGDRSVLQALSGFFDAKHPLFTRRWDFYSGTPMRGTPTSDWLQLLKRKAKECQLVNMTEDDQVIHRLLATLEDKELLKKLLQVPKLTLVRMEETILEHKKTLSTLSFVDNPAAKALRTGGPQPRGRSSSRGNRGSSPSRGKPGKEKSGKIICYVCGTPGHKSPDCKYDKSTVVCNKCQKKGHIAPACRDRSNSPSGSSRGSSGGRGRRSRKDSPHRSSRPKSPTPSAVRSVATVSARSGQLEGLSYARVTGSQPTPLKQLSFSHKNGKSFTAYCIPDTGSTRTIMRRSLLARCGIPIKRTGERIVTANDERMDCAGTVTLTCTRPDLDISTTVDVLVSEDLKDDVLVAWHDLQALGIIDSAFPHSDFLKRKGTKKNSPVVCRAAHIDNCSELSDILKDFSDVLSDKLDASKVMKGPPLHIYTREDKSVSPWKSLTARQVPLHLKEAADKVVQEALAAGIIAPVTEPTDWISPGFFVEKDGGKGVRLVSDFSHLNKVVDRQVHPFPSTLEMMRSIDPTSKVFCKLGAVQGYFQIPLDEESSHLTTFLLPSGRYRYLRAPMGLSSSSGAWCQQSDEAISGLEGVTKLVDDILIQAPSLAVLRDRIRAVLDRCREHGITISRRKFLYGPEVEFAGFLVSASGIRPNPDKLKAVKDFPTPVDLTDLRSFLGMANQLGHFIPDLSHATKCMRQLMQKGTAFAGCLKCKQSS
ncbi:MAG: hypothetical protein HC888_04345 [Candidatus Competibacteraceae bacterium]|nr:hypothetical protein [Candidatus Competibacteraceae bacterium]